MRRQRPPRAWSRGTRRASALSRSRTRGEPPLRRTGGTAAYSLLEVAVSSLIFSSPRSDRETEQHRLSQGAARTHQKLHHCYPPGCRPRPGPGSAEKGGRRRENGGVNDLYPGNTKSCCPALQRISLVFRDDDDDGGEGSGRNSSNNHGSSALELLPAKGGQSGRDEGGLRDAKKCTAPSSRCSSSPVAAAFSAAAALLLLPLLLSCLPRPAGAGGGRNSSRHWSRHRQGQAWKVGGRRGAERLG